MERTYRGPLRSEPIAIELHNTVFAAPGGRVDGLADEDSARAFLHDIAPRLGLEAETARDGAADAGLCDDPRGQPPDAGRSDDHGRAELVALRETVAAALRATLTGEAPARETLDALNAAAGRAPLSLRAQLEAGGGGVVSARPDHHGATPAEVVRAMFAADAIDLITGPRRELLRACGAPGCILMYLQDDPRRRWCSGSCGNRARQARHYERSRGR